MHALVADGVFLPSGAFRVLPALPEEALTQTLREAVLTLLVEHECITAEFAERLLAWRHSGFSVHNRVRVRAGDPEGRKQLARYMIRAPFALEKMRYDAATGMVVYRSKMHATLKRNYQLVPGARWLELLLQHVPDKNEHLVRYYGHYSSRTRGERARREAGSEEATTPQGDSLAIVEDGATSHAARASWARLIKQVYESDPLICPGCGTEMRIIALIEDENVIRRILEHLGRYDPRPPGPGPPVAGADGPWPQGSQIPLTYHPLPDIA